MEAAQAARIAFLKILPAVVETDLDDFGEGLEAMQRYGWKRVQIDRQSEAVRLTMGETRRLGLRGVGMTSWGPTLFGFTAAGPEAEQSIMRAVREFGVEHGGSR
ncbi:MAG: hypothetical protein M5U27_03465 [Gaiella sp.]|nr:hypothetical protein [Gaiella sp.]